jgi:hypothetical protein
MFISDLLITPASEMTSWQNIFVAVVPVLGLIAVAYLQFVHKAGKKRGEEAQEANALFMAQWEINKQDHDFVVNLIDNMGKSLGHSIDRVEGTVNQNHKVMQDIDRKLDTHIRDHAIGNFDLDNIKFKTGEKAKDGK